MNRICLHHLTDNREPSRSSSNESRGCQWLFFVFFVNYGFCSIALSHSGWLRVSAYVTSINLNITFKQYLLLILNHKFLQRSIRHLLGFMTPLQAEETDAE